ncbi:MAG: hypothetical protein K8953_00305, partial [Proteobacteria bacterium]|nr:hypothetical protein [Pseudomonadota bacterium]
TATFKGTAFGEDAADGISWFWDSANTRGYAGILSGTDLGAPLVQSGAAQVKWHGHFRATGGLSRDFLLEIDFDNNPNGIEAFVYHTNANYYHITGNFGANGVITGKVNYGTFSDLTARTTDREPNGVLTGLIGADGAVGAFISGTGDKNTITASDPVVNYAGGFVAKPTDALDDNVVNYDDWARSFATLPPVVLDNTATPRAPQFLGTVDGDDKLLETGVGDRGVSSNRKGTLTLADSFSDITFAGDIKDGVSFFWDNTPAVGHAGLLAGTDLGALLTQDGGDPQVFWNGLFHATIGSRASNIDIKLVFSLKIDFANNANKIEAFVQQRGDYHYYLTGSFDDKGVITGKVNFGRFLNDNKTMPMDNRAPNGFLTGLIGAEGAVGAFISGTGTKDALTTVDPVIYAGGFVAHPTATSTANNVKFSTWTAAF